MLSAIAAGSVLLASSGTSDARLQTLNRALDAVLQRGRTDVHAPAAAAALVRCGRVVWADASGVLDLRTKRPATNQSLFVLNSTAKSLIATMIMQEVAAGHLSLSTKLSRFYPRLPNAAAISIRMLLNMTSGLPDYLGNQRIKWMIRNRPQHRWTVGQVLSGLGSGLGTPRFPPGRGFQYSDTNYIVLGAILARVTRSPVQRDLERLIGKPLGIASATYVPTPAAEAQIAHPYLLRPDGSLVSQWARGFGISSAVWGPVFTDGGVAASASDLARFANALLGGRLVSSRAVRQMTRLDRGNYGFGITARRFDGHRWLGQNGVFGGFAAEDWSDPARRLTITLATNVERSSGGQGLMADRIWRTLAQTYDRRTRGLVACR